VGFYKLIGRKLSWDNVYQDVLWTNIPATDPSDRDIYCSDSSGSDAQTFGHDYGDGTLQGQQARPFKTIQGAKAALRNLHGDRIWLKCGDTFTNVAGENIFGNMEGISGFSSLRRMIFGSYGAGARPILRTGTSSAISLANHDNPCNHLLILSLELTAHLYDGSGAGPYGIAWLDHSTDVTTEDCYIHNWRVCINYQAFTGSGIPIVHHAQMAIRGCVLADTYNNDSNANNAHGVYADYCDGLTIEWCTFDQCGYFNNATTYWTQFDHACYIQDTNTAVVFRYNVITNSDGVQIRPGGYVNHNICSRTIQPYRLGGHSGALESPAISFFEDNCAFEGYAYAMRISSVIGGTLARCVWAHGSTVDHLGNPRDPYGLVFETTDATLPSCMNMTVEDNRLYDWGGPSFRFSALPAQYAAIVFRRNAAQNPTFNIGGIFSNTVISTNNALDSSHLTASANNYVPHTFGAQPVNVGGSNETLATWNDAIGDTTSNSVAPVYKNPSFTLATFGASVGFDGTHAGIVAGLRGQGKASWRTDISAGAIVKAAQDAYSIA
jgi:hypothetical protein